MKKKVMVAFNNLQDNTMTDVVFCLLEWQKYYANHPTIEIEIFRCKKWGFEHNFNEFMRYAVENNFDYVFQYDCDMVGDKTVLERLISHDKEAVGCLYYSRKDRRPQYWKATGEKDIDMFWEYSYEQVLEAIDKKTIIPSDVRASGFTLFKVSAIKELEYPYGEMKPNNKVPFSINGFDMDITWKLSRKFGAVWTDPDPELKVYHITNHPIGVLEGINIGIHRKKQDERPDNQRAS